MKIFCDIITKDNVLTDLYTIKEVHGGFIYEVRHSSHLSDPLVLPVLSSSPRPSSTAHSHEVVRCTCKGNGEGILKSRVL